MDRIDLLELDEIADLDRVRGLGLSGLDLLRLEDHELALADLVAAGQVLPRHFLVLGEAEALLLDGRTVLLVNEAKADVLVLGRGVQLYRDRHHAEADRALPDRPQPVLLPASCASADRR